MGEQKDQSGEEFKGPSYHTLHTHSLSTFHHFQTALSGTSHRGSSKQNPLPKICEGMAVKKLLEGKWFALAHGLRGYSTPWIGEDMAAAAPGGLECMAGSPAPHISMDQEAERERQEVGLAIKPQDQACFQYPTSSVQVLPSKSSTTFQINIIRWEPSIQTQEPMVDTHMSSKATAPEHSILSPPSLCAQLQSIPPGLEKSYAGLENSMGCDTAWTYRR